MAKRVRSNVPQFRIRVPVQVLDRLRGKRVLLHLSHRAGPPFVKVIKVGIEIAFSLGTTDSFVATARQDDALDHLRRLFDLTAAEPVTLSHKNMVALSGEAYRLYFKVHEENPGEPLSWRYAALSLPEPGPPYRLQRPVA